MRACSLTLLVLLASVMYATAMQEYDPIKHREYVGKDPLPENHCDHPENEVIGENCLQGNPVEEWDVNGAGDPTIQGFSTDISYNVGSVAEFKINTTADDFRVDIYRTGYYGGLGARLVATVEPTAPRSTWRQPACDVDPATWEYDCGNWAVNSRWSIPANAVSGVYLARAVRIDREHEARTWRTDNSQVADDPRFAMPGGASAQRPQPQPHAYGANGLGKLRNPIKEPRASLIYFVVRNDASTAKMVFQTSDTVWQAYNPSGGTSTYGSFDPANPKPRCFKSSYNRPLTTRTNRPTNTYFGAEYPMVRFLEAHGYDVTYIAGVDTDRFGDMRLKQHKVFLSTGHDEYWSGQQRKNVESARDHGVHLAFFSGNKVYWRIRWEKNYRSMVCYKESQDVKKIDPNTTEWTGTFRDSRPINPLGAQPENALTGTIFTMNAWRNDPLVVPYRYSHLRQWRHTKVARLFRGRRAILHRGILGHEMDEDVNNGFRPANLIRLSETQIDNVMYIQDFGSTYDSGSALHHLTMYKAPNSGALVFDAGTVQWSWALDGMHDSETGIPAPFANNLNIRIGRDILAPEPAIQQFTVNLFADMHVMCPLCGVSGLLRTLPSVDEIPPTCRIVNVTSGDPTRKGTHEFDHELIRIDVDTHDDGGGVVAGVEVSLFPSHLWYPLHRTERKHDPMTETSEGKITRDPAHHRLWTGVVRFPGHFWSDDNDLQFACRATDDSLNTNLELKVFDTKVLKPQRPPPGGLIVDDEDRVRDL